MLSVRRILLLCIVAIRAQFPGVDCNAGDAAAVDYINSVKPVLKERCYACHGALKQEAGLRLDTVSGMLRGGSGGPVVRPGQVSSSELLRRVSSSDPSVRMPPEGRSLTSEEIAAISAWLQSGAEAPEKEAAEADPLQHWAFRPPVRPSLPGDSGGSQLNPVDAFVADKLRENNIQPLARAGKATLLRRAWLDLLGVPPEPDDLRRFLADEAPDAFARVIDRLLEDPRYGERWARHWMDVWRYSDWYGRRHVPDVWNSAPQIWRWRDWIVNSLNSDHGYDRLLQEMLAADEIRPEDDEAAVATGYLIRNWYALNPNDWMRNIVEHTGKAFLGLTFNCAHCHDHKYDPIAQTDYFRFRAFFEPISIRQDRVPGQADPGLFQEYEYSKLRIIQRLGMVRIYDKSPAAPTWFYTGGDERNRDREKGSISPGLPAFLPAADAAQLAPVELPTAAWYPGLRPALIEAIRGELAKTAVSAEQQSQAATSAAAIPPEVSARLATAEGALQSAAAQAAALGMPGALAGSQSLLFDATTGRRALQHRLAELKSLPDDSVITFQLRLLQDAHFNFQLARDVVKGLTAGYVAFDRGRIMAYQPGGFSEFQAGSYDTKSGQTHFLVELRIHPSADHSLLTVRTLPDQALLVNAIPVALNSWNATVYPNQAVSFDARAGSRVLVDDFRFNNPDRVVAFDFEAPQFPAEVEVAGIAGWEASHFSESPAVSMVSAVAGNLALEPLHREVLAARRAAVAAHLPRKAAAAKLAAARSCLAAFEAGLSAETAKFAASPPTNAAQLAIEANRLERLAALHTAEADVLTAELALAAAESLAINSPERPKQIEAAGKSLAAASNALAAARTAQAAPPSETYKPLGPEYPRTSTGRRKALALSITSRNNPLTARVAVNHIWLRHFNAPLVATVADFGRNGSAPTHPELLDWLAVEFMDSGWSLKHLHRLILNSEAWQRSGVGSNSMSAAPSATTSATTADPENRFLWRRNPGRMEAEVVRDSLLAVAGLLDFTRGGQELENSEALTTFRRSLYYAVYPEQGGRNGLGELFDSPDPLDCYRRTASIVPQQALALTNSDLVHQVSSHVAKRIGIPAQERKEAPPGTKADGDKFAPPVIAAETYITAAFELILSRQPSPTETNVCLEFLKADDSEANRQSLVRALLNHNDFVTIR